MKNILSSLLLGGAVCASLGSSCQPRPEPVGLERVATVEQALGTVDFCYFGGPTLPNMTLNGSAAIDGTGLELTKAESSKNGSVFVNTTLSSGSNIHAAFELKFSGHANGGGEGIAFVMQAAPAGAQALQTSIDSDAGKFLGYDGLTPAIAVEFDTRASGSYDPDGNHVGLTRGRVDHDDLSNKGLPVNTAPFDMKAAASVHVWLDYLSATHELAVYLSTSFSKPSLPLLVTTKVDLATELGPTFYAGFTASTGHEASPQLAPVSRQQVLGFVVTDHAADPLSSCCLTNVDCKNAAASVCNIGFFVCGACALDDASKCAAGEGCDVSNNAGKCVPSCKNDGDCESPGFPVCSTSGATAGSCVVCDASFGASGNHACGATAKLCKASGFCASALGNGTTCTAAADCEAGFCVDGVCCNEACGGNAPNDCHACSKAKGSTKDGECMALADAAVCEDGDLCTVEDACFQGTCMVGNATNCSTNGFCQSDKGCTCKAGFAGLICQYSDATTCSGHGVAELAGTCKCDANYGGAFCNKCAENHFGDFCTSVCSPASCAAPATGCQTAACSAEGTCVYTVVAEGATCTDGNPCTETDTCIGNTCVGGKAKSCAAEDGCHGAGVCDYQTGNCVNPVFPDLTACSAAEGAPGSCAGGACVAIDPLAGRGAGGTFGAQGGYACSVARPGTNGAGPVGFLGGVLLLGVLGVARRRASPAAPLP